MFLFTSKVITQNGYTAQCSIIVKTSITSLSVSPTSKTVYVGDTVQLTGTINPSTTTENTLWTSSNKTVATVNDSGLVTAKSAGTVTITFKNSSGTKSASCTITVENYKKALETESYVGYYADVDGDGTVDGIIFADLLHGKSGQWGDYYDYGTYTIPTIESTKVKSYKISQEDYTNQLGGTSKILTPSGDGNDRFYVMALTDIATDEYTFGCSLSGTTITFGNGKTNTQTLIGKANLNSSLKEQIQPKVNKGWFIPSKEEWSAFGEELGIVTTNYSDKGLSSWYWSSSQDNFFTNYAWYANFNLGYMYDLSINSYSCVRLATTF